MKITVDGSPEEIAAFVTATQSLEVVPPSSEAIQRITDRYNGIELCALTDNAISTIRPEG